MKPIIGVILRKGISPSENKILYMNDSIRLAITNSGGIPIGIMECNDMYRLIDKCNGIVFQGGDSFSETDKDLLKYAYDHDIPTLGICLGMQLMGVVFNGNLIDIDKHKSKDKYVHYITIDKSSKLYSILKSDHIITNSRHRSALINTSLDVASYSEDGVIEAVEDKNKKFFIGVEWHPEDMITYDILENSIFDYFIKISGSD